MFMLWEIIWMMKISSMFDDVEFRSRHLSLANGDLAPRHQMVAILVEVSSSMMTVS